MTDVPRHEHHEIKGNEEELTRIGKFLRRFKIDEIPQLWNILRGEMSFIGPRPALPEQIKEYDDFSRQRLLVLPGATGLAQVHGNIHLTWQQRWQYDVQYVHNVSFCLDAWIFFRSIGVILAGEKRFLNRRMKNMKKKIPENPRIVLAGAVSSTRCILKSLTRNQMNVVGVFGLAEEASAGVSGYTRLDDLAIRNKIPYHDFRNLNHTETIQKIQQCQPDLLFAVGISQLLHPELLAVPTVGCVGFHPTRLPVGRGRAPIAWIILDNVPAAASFFLMEEEADAGALLVQEPFEVKKDDYAADVIRSMEEAIGRAMDRWLPDLKRGIWKPLPQDESRATYYGKRSPEDGSINWNAPREQTYALIRATSKPHPGAFTYLGETRVIVWRAQPELKLKYRGCRERCCSKRLAKAGWCRQEKGCSGSLNWNSFRRTVSSRSPSRWDTTGSANGGDHP